MRRKMERVRKARTAGQRWPRRARAVLRASTHHTAPHAAPIVGYAFCGVRGATGPTGRLLWLHADFLVWRGLVHGHMGMVAL